MCGIAAYVGHNYDSTYFKYIALAQDDRGKHGCGLYFQTPALDHHVCIVGGEAMKANRVFNLFEYPLPEEKARKFSKASSIGELFVTEKEVPKFASVALAHSRKATSGSNSVINSHPVYWKSIAGNEIYLVHNGTILNWEYLDETYLKDDPRKPTSDSQMLAKAISMAKFEVLSYIQGSATILWVNGLNSKLYAYCSKPFKSTRADRPIHYINVGGSYYLSSISGVLNTIAMLATTPDQYIKSEEELPAETIYEFPGMRNCGVIKRVLPKVEKVSNNKFSGQKEDFSTGSQTVKFFEGKYYDGSTLLSCKFTGDVPIPIYISRYRRVVERVDGKYYINGAAIDAKQHDVKAFFFYDGILFKSDVLLIAFRKYFDNPMVASYLLQDLIGKVQQPIWDPLVKRYLDPDTGKPMGNNKPFTAHIMLTRYKFIIRNGVLINKAKISLREFHKRWDNNYLAYSVKQKSEDTERKSPSMGTPKTLRKMSSMLKRRVANEDNKQYKNWMNHLIEYIDGHLPADSQYN